MIVMAEKDIDRLLREKLKQAGLLDHVDEGKSSLFTTPEGVLADIVLKDASALESAKRVVEEAERELEQGGVWLLPTVRALWEVKGVEKVEGTYQYGLPEGVGILFRGLLQSGRRTQEVWVSVTPSAFQLLKPLLAGGDDALRNIVRDFLGHQLSIGGAGYWDPIREPRQEIDEGAALYLRWRPYEALKASIDNVFNPSGYEIREESVTRFVKTVNFGQGTRKIRRFLDVLEDLPGPGVAYSRGEWLPTSNHEFYSMLLEQEKRELESYYLDQVAKAEKEFPPLKAQYPAVFN